MPENVTGFQPTGNLKKSLIDMAYSTCCPAVHPHFSAKSQYSKRWSDFLAGVLDYVAGDEALLRAVAGHAAVAPEELDRARQVLSGDDWQRDAP